MGIALNMQSALLLLYAVLQVAALASGAPQTPDKTQELDDAENLVKELSKKTDLDRSSSYRCGMFFPDPADVTGLQGSPLLIFNSSWPAPECGAGSPDYDKYNIKAPFVCGKSKKFPVGLQIAMFSNACGDEEWTNSESYHGEKVCCKTGEYIPCEEL